MVRARSVEVDRTRVETIRAAVAAAWPRYEVSLDVVRLVDTTATAVLVLRQHGAAVLTTTVHGYDVEDALRTLASWAQVPT
jgi:ABC-type transporter Mla MlaB component